MSIDAASTTSATANAAQTSAAVGTAAPVIALSVLPMNGPLAPYAHSDFAGLPAHSMTIGKCWLHVGVGICRYEMPQVKMPFVQLVDLLKCQTSDVRVNVIGFGSRWPEREQEKGEYLLVSDSLLKKDGASHIRLMVSAPVELPFDTAFHRLLVGHKYYMSILNVELKISESGKRWLVADGQTSTFVAVGDYSSYTCHCCPSCPA